MKISLIGAITVAAVLVFPTHAQNFPDMVGVWTGAVRVVSSGNIERDRLDRGGVVINEINLELIIDAQDGETFIGRTRTSQTPASNAGAHVWGSIRSAGDEAVFITESGGRGHLWFEGATAFEYCFTNLDEESITSYCARLTKQ